MIEEELLTDEDICRVFDIKPRTLREHLLNGPPSGDPDVRKIKRLTIFRKRRWLKSSLEKFLQSEATTT